MPFLLLLVSVTVAEPPATQPSTSCQRLCDALEKRGRVPVIAVVSRVDEECSAMGGTHLTLEVLGSGGVVRLAYGGHDFHPATPLVAGDTVLATYVPPAASSSYQRPGAPCVYDLPPADAAATDVILLDRAGTTAPRLQTP